MTKHRQRRTYPSGDIYRGTDPAQADGEIYTAATHDRIVAVIDGLLATHFSDGDPALLNQAPRFTSDPVVTADATRDTTYTGDLAMFASDPEDDPLTFSKITGPAWLGVAPDGALTGTPGVGNDGLNIFTVHVTDGDKAHTAKLHITVFATPDLPSFADYISNPDFGIDPSEQGFNDDPDGDGLANGLEAWFGTHPGEFSTGLANVARDGNTITFTHQRNENPPTNISGFYEWSPNLVDWYPGDGVAGPDGGPTVTITAGSTETTTTVTAIIDGAANRIFVRAGVTQN